MASLANGDGTVNYIASNKGKPRMERGFGDETYCSHTPESTGIATRCRDHAAATVAGKGVVVVAGLYLC